MKVGIIGQYHAIPLTVLYWGDMLDLDAFSEGDWLKEMMRTNFYI